MPYRTHTADRAAGQRWLTVLIHPGGRFADHHEHPQDLTWTLSPTGDLCPGDVVRCTITDRVRTSTELLFYAGLTPDDRAVATRSKPEYDLETYYVLRADQLTFVYRPQAPHTVLRDDGPHFFPWQPTHTRRLLWVPDVPEPYRDHTAVNSRGVTFRVSGTDVQTGELILTPHPDPLGVPVTFSVTPADLARL